MLKDGAFKIANAGYLPGGGKKPEDVLDELRRVLARRNYAALMRILTPETRAAVEADVRSLVTGLEHVDALNVQVTGEVATVVVPGGHHVRLRRDNGSWRVEDFD